MKIFEGNVSDTAEWPWAVRLRHFDGSASWLCGGSRVRPKPISAKIFCRIHAVWFIRDTSIRDMVEFPKQSKGHMVIETIGSDTAKGQSSF